MRLTAEDHRLRAITEAQWQRTVIDIASACGWVYYHPPRAGFRSNGTVRHVPAGFPDLVLARDTRLIFAELKRETGKTTEAQDAWLAALARTSSETYIWRPSDLDEVRATLGRRS